LFIQEPTIISEGTRSYGFRTGLSGTPNTAKAGADNDNTSKTLNNTKKYLFKFKEYYNLFRNIYFIMFIYFNYRYIYF
jgi:hypothetical protein